MNLIAFAFWCTIGSAIVALSIWLYSRRINVSNWTRRVAENLNIKWSDTATAPPQQQRVSPCLIVRSPPPLMIELPQTTESESSFRKALLKMIDVRIQFLEDAIWNQKSGRENKHDVKLLEQTLKLLQQQKRNLLGNS